MLSLLDFPDDILYHIGLHLEHDLRDLGLFLLIHPRINRLCHALRYRYRVAHLGERSPLPEYLDNPSWLKHVRTIRISAFRLGLEQRGSKSFGEALKQSKRHDEQLANIIRSLTRVHEVILEIPHWRVRTDGPCAVLHKTHEALKNRREIQQLRIMGFDSTDELEQGLRVAQSLPGCVGLTVARTDFTTRGVTIPIANHLASLPAPEKLRNLALVGLHSWGDPDSPDLRAIPPLPGLQHLTVQDDDPVWTNQKRQSEVGFLAALLKKASNINTLEILLPAMHALAGYDVQPSPVLLHLKCPYTVRNLGTAWYSTYTSVRTLTCSGYDAQMASWSLLKQDRSAESCAFVNLQTLNLIDLENGWASQPAYSDMAYKQGIALKVLPQPPNYSRVATRAADHA